jgi:hypothetical protein
MTATYIYASLAVLLGIVGIIWNGAIIIAGHPIGWLGFSLASIGFIIGLIVISG